MAVTKSTGGVQIVERAASGQEQRSMLGSIGLVGIVAMLLASTWIDPTFVVALSSFLLLAGFALAAHAWWRSIARDTIHPTPWDVAGLGVFAGFAGLIGANTALF